MGMHDSVQEKDSGAPAGRSSSTGASGRISIDRVELKHSWVQGAEEQRVEETLNLYAKAALQRMQSGAPEVPDSEDSEEEREARSQQLKLQQKCQDIAALRMVEELEDEELE